MARARREGARERVVLCVQNLGVPQDRRVWREARALRAAGYDVTVVAPRHDGQPRRDTLEGIAVIRYRRGPALAGNAGYLVELVLGLVGTLYGLAVARVRGPLAVIHTANPPDTGVIAALPFLGRGTRFVYDQHDLCPELLAVRSAAADGRVAGATYAIARPLLAVLERLSYRVAALVIAPNNSYRRIALGRGHKRSESVVTVRSGPDALRAPSAPCRERLTVAFAGVIGAQDRVDVLLHAGAELLGRRPGCIRLELIGDGDDVPRLKGIARDLGIEEDVDWVGWLTGSTLDDRLAAADVAVSLDDDNPFCQLSTMTKVPEYLALGLPCVVSDLVENRVTCGNAAIYFPAGDAMALSKVLEELVDDRDLLGRMRAAAADRAPLLLWDVSARRLVGAYDWLLSSGPVVAGDHLLPD